MQYLARFLCLLLLLALIGLFASPIHAQDTVTPFVDIAVADATHLPTVRVAVYGDTAASGGVTGNLGDLPLQVRENDQVQTILSDTTEVVGSQLAVVLDPHDLSAVGSSGQPHHAEVAGILLDMIEQEAVVRNQDWLAAFTAGADGELQTIQDWTGEPNLIFNSTVQSDVNAAAGADQLTALTLGVLDKFQAPAPVGLARAVLLFSAGNSQLDLEKVIARANAEHVHFHIVELTDPAAPPANEGALQDLARQTNGAYVRLQGPEDLPPLWRRLAAMRTQRVLTYNSSATGPATLAVEVTPPGGAPLVANADLAIAAAVLPQAAATADAVAPTPEAASETATEAAPTPEAAPAAGASDAPAAAEVVPLAAEVQPQQEEPAAEGAPPTAEGTGETPGETLGDAPGEVVFVPGTSLALPRPLLELSLPILLILLAFFGFRELRARRKPARGAGAEAALAPGSDYAAQDEPDDLQPLQPLRPRKPSSRNVNAVQEDELQSPAPAALLAPARAPVEEEDYDEATVVPMRFDDNEATYRLREAIDLPLLGVLVRVTNDPNLPQQLPVYGLNPGPGEARQIHIGRHSKNNTVVINDKSVSPQHAVIIQKDGRLYLRDNASTAGTYLNWRQLKPGEELLLRHNDLISFGEIVYEFRNKGEDEATVANG